MSASKFALGRIVMTPGVRDSTTEEWRLEVLGRHARGDWGDCEPDDARLNDQAIELDDRVVSVYHQPGGAVLVITEADRSVTTILLASEY